MFVNALADRPKSPDDVALVKPLGPAKVRWDELTTAMAPKVGLGAAEWKSYSPKAGWTMRLFHKKRAIIYLSPARGWFLASFTLGERAVRAALGMGLSAVKRDS